MAITCSCGKPGPGPNHINMQKQVDSLKRELANTYKPGLGEIMGRVQVHHNKLWFAGNAANWELADFEINEIKEALDDIVKYEQDRPESKSIGTLKPAIDSLQRNIQMKDKDAFKKGFTLLTNACNNCHQANKFGFNKIIIPTQPAFSNQAF